MIILAPHNTKQVLLDFVFSTATTDEHLSDQP